MAITTFRSLWHPNSNNTNTGQANGWVRYTDLLTVPIYQGSKIPSDNVTIKKVTFTLYTKIYGTGNTFFLTNIAPQISGNNLLVADGGLLLSQSSAFILQNNDSITGYTIEGNIIPSIYQNQESVNVILSRTRKSNTSQSGYINEGQDYVQIDVEWEQKTKCSAPFYILLSSNTAKPGSEVKLSWLEAAAGTGTSISGYQVYRKETENGVFDKYGDPIWTGLTSGSVNVEAPSIKDKIYYYTVQTLSSDGENFNSEISSYKAVAIQATYTENVINSLTINQKQENIYIGESGVNLSLICNATSGTNNSIVSYQFYEDERLLQEGSQNTYTGTLYGEKTYSVKITDEYGTEIEKEIKTILMKFQEWNDLNSFILNSENYTIPIILTVPTSEPASALVSNSIRYSTFYEYDKEDGTIEKIFLNTELNSIPTSITIPNTFSRGQPFRIGVSAKGYAIDGGYTEISQTSGEIKIISLPIPAVINSMKDKYDTAGTGYYAYGEVEILFEKASNTNNPNSELSYSLVTIINDGSENVISITPVDMGENILSTIYDISTLSEGTKIGIKIRATDEYNNSVDSKQEIITKFINPVITLNSPVITQSSLEDGSLSCSIKGSFNGSLPAMASGSNIKYIVETLLGNDVNTTKLEGNFNENGLVEIEPFIINFPRNIQEDTPSFDKTLYETVITNQNPQPTGKLRITYYYDNFQAYAQQKTINITYNFYKGLKDITEPVLEYPEGREYINPFEALTFYYEAEDTIWTNAAGQPSNGGKINVYIEGINFTKDESKKSFAVTYNNYTPQDMEIIFSLIYELTFSGAAISDKKIVPVSIKLARWYKDIEDLVLKAVNFKTNGNERVIAGTLQLPNLKCASSNYKNLTEVSYIIKDTEEQISEEGNFNLTENEVNFEIATELTEINLYADVTFKNTSNDIITLATPIVHLLDSQVTLAIRKGFIGVNTTIDYNPDSANNAILTINASQSDSTTSTKIIELSDGLNNSIFSMTPNGLEITNLLLGGSTLDNFLTVDITDAETGSANLINADTLGGIKAEDFALKTDLGNIENISFDKIEGILSVSKGGTGASFFSKGKVLLGNDANAFITRDITNNTSVVNINKTDNLITENTLYYYKGTTNINIVGTITSGIWQGEKISSAYIDTLTTDNIPNLNANKITEGILNTAQIPDLNASKITEGTFDAARIPSLAASKITSGTFSTSLIPNLSASKITSGTIAAARLPFIINRGSTTVYGDDGTWISFSTAFSNTNYSIIATYSKTGDLVSGGESAGWGPLKIYGKTTTGCYITIGGSSSTTLYNADWIAIGA